MCMKKLIPGKMSKTTFYTEKLENQEAERGTNSRNSLATGVIIDHRSKNHSHKVK